MERDRTTHAGVGDVGRALGELLEEAIKEYNAERRRRGKDRMSKEKLARLLGVSAFDFSRILHKSQRVRNREGLIRVGQELALPNDRISELLRAAGLPEIEKVDPDVPPRMEWGSAQSPALAGDVVRPAPDRAAMASLVEGGWRTLAQAWHVYLRGREHLNHRQWSDVLDIVEEGRSHYMALRRLADTYLAQLDLLQASADHQISAPDEAIEAAKRALAASDASGDAWLRVRARARLGDVYKAMGSMGRALRVYAEALTIAREAERLSPDDMVWVPGWVARIERKQGTAHLFGGRPSQAYGLLTGSIDAFKGLQDDYELANTCVARAWLYNHCGRTDEALGDLGYGDAALERMRRTAPEPDARLQLETDLCRASVHLNRHEINEANAALERAKGYIKVLAVQPAVSRGQGSSQQHSSYHEAGRYHLLAGRAALATDAPDRLNKARDELLRGRRFHEKVALKNPPRLASLYHASALVEIEADDLLKAEGFINKTMEYAEASDPENHYYRAMAAVTRFVIATRRAKAELDVDVNTYECDARRACAADEEPMRSRHLARLEVARARWELWLERPDVIDAFVEHAVRALRHAAAYSPFLAKDTAKELRDSLADEALSQQWARKARQAIVRAVQESVGQRDDALPPSSANLDLAVVIMDQN